MLSEFPMFQKGQVEEIYKDFEPKDKIVLDEYLKYRIARGLVSDEKIKDIRRYYIQIYYVLGEDFKKLFLPVKKENEPLKILRELLALIRVSKHYEDNTKKNYFDFLKNFLKYRFSDWSLRFSNLEDVKISKNNQSEKSKVTITKEDVEKLMKHETKMFWKAFLITQYEGGLRTGETRFLKWSDIKFNVDEDISEISIYATKTKKARTIYVKDATFYLKKLKEEQENTEKKGVYIFHSKTDFNQPVDKFTISIWCRSLSRRALGKPIWNYLLRHARATELYNLADDNKIAEKTAMRFMGHSTSMIKVYQNLDKNKVKDALKNQVYKLEELPPDKKAELEKEIDEQKKTVSSLQDAQLEMQKQLKKTQKRLEKESKENKMADKFFMNLFKHNVKIRNIIEKDIPKDKRVDWDKVNI